MNDSMTQPKTILVASVKNECPYLLEFVAHYRLLGFDEVLVVTNDNTDETLTLLEPLQAAGFLRYIAHSVPPTDAPLRNANRLAMKYVRANAPDAFVYVADADEFLILPQDATIGDYLRRFPDATCICFNWKFYGSDGHVERPKGLVMSAYTRRAEDEFREHRTLKSMFRVEPNLSGFGSHFPYHDNLEGVIYQYADGVKFPASQIYDKPHQGWSRVTYELAAVNHYGIKSLSEYRLKQARGRGAVNSMSSRTRYNDEYFEKFDNNVVVDVPDPAHIERVRGEMELMYRVAGLEKFFTREYLGL
jgi:hypothetical protein